MTAPEPSRVSPPRRRRGVVRFFAAQCTAFLFLPALLWLAPLAHAQLSLTSAVDLAIGSSPRVRMAQADLDKARSAYNETHDAYYPTVQGVMDLGYSYGAPIGEPTLFSFEAHSLVFSYSQKDYTRAARSGVAAAELALAEARQEVAEDAAVTYVALDAAQQSHDALAQQLGFASRLATIIQERIDAGQDSELESLQARQTAAQIRLQMLRLDDEMDGYHSHLARIDGIPDGPLTTQPESIPPLPVPALPNPSMPQPLNAALSPEPDTPDVAAAFANARAKQEQAFGDARYLYRPQLAFFGEYSRFSTFNNYETYYPAFANNTLNAIGIGIQITIPFYDRMHQDKARESAADAVHAEQEALSARNQMFEGRTKLQHAAAELSVQADLAGIDRQIAQKQLDAILIQLQAGNGNPNAPQLSPEDEQKARIQERQKFLDMLSAKSRLSQTQIQILRLTGQLEAWLKSAISVQAPAPSVPAVQPGPR
jgi:outer membrane protein TolC